MLRRLHNHMYAARLTELVTTSPFVFVYQVMGSVSAAEAKALLQASLDTALPDSGYKAEALRVRNTVTRSTGNAQFSALFQASNLLVGWRNQAHVAALPPRTAVRDSTFEQLYADLANAADLKAWQGLDELQEYGKLLGVMEGPARGLVGALEPGAALTDVLERGAGGGVVLHLELAQALQGLQQQQQQQSD